MWASNPRPFASQVTALRKGMCERVCDVQDRISLKLNSYQIIRVHIQ